MATTKLKNKCIDCGAPCRIKRCRKHSEAERALAAIRYNASKNKNRLRAHQCRDNPWNVMARMIKPDTNVEDRILFDEDVRYGIVR